MPSPRLPHEPTATDAEVERRLRYSIAQMPEGLREMRAELLDDFAR